MKQTAVEWYFTELWTSPKDKFIWHRILEKAKAMEKRQITDAYNNGQQIPPFEYAEKYYNETYGDK
jgi:HEPN domain-containing protein